MSCQQVSRLITPTTSSLTSSSGTASTLVVHEDPYVFTETLSTTPPILFNAQKLRTKTTLDSQIFNATVVAATTTTATLTTNTANTITTTNQQKIVLNGKVAAKTQASVTAAALAEKTHQAVATTTPTVTKAKSTNFKSVTQSQKDTRQQQQDKFNKSKNVCAQQRLPQLQLQQTQKQAKQLPTQLHQKQHQIPAQPEQALPQPKQQTPPPLYSHTPSLWQTPLLLDTIPTGASPPTSPASLPSPSAASSMANGSASSQTLLVSPTLPPSRFHHTTMAHHLQKVECLKKSKRPNTNNNNNNNNNNKNNINANNNNNLNSNGQQATTKELTRNATVLSTVPPPLQALQTQKHSETDLNEIPVNVIFRKPPAGTTSNVTERALTPPMECNANGMKKVKIMPAQQYTSLPLTPPSPTPVQPTFSPKQMETQNQTHLPATNSNLRSNTVLTQILPSNANVSINKQHTTTSSMQHTSINDSICNNNLPATLKISNKSIEQLNEQQTNILPKTPCSSTVKRKANGNSANPIPISNSVPYAHKKRKAQLGSLCSSMHMDHCLGSTTAVAVKKLSASEAAADISPLSDPSCLPYCLQNSWIDVNHTRQGTYAREERITQHKNQLKRQALQLLSTRSLQKLPLQLAWRRLVNVNQLLKKHKNHCDTENQSSKQCQEDGCNNPVLVMALHCLHHITHNQTQHIFMACSAKTAENKFCNAPVMETYYDKAFCAIHAQERQQYKAVYAKEQQRQKLVAISAENQKLYYEKDPQLLQDNYVGDIHNKPVEVHKMIPTTTRKRKNNVNNNTISIKSNANVSGNENSNGDTMRPLKRVKKSVNENSTITAATMSLHNTIPAASTTAPFGTAPSMTTLTSPPPLSAVMHRKASTTSLESIASNSHSSSSQPTTQSQTSQPQFVNTSLPPPALAPLSNHHTPRKINLGLANSVNGSVAGLQAHNIVAGDLKAHEINQIVAQLNLGPYNNNNNYNNMNYMAGTNGNQLYASNTNSNHSNNSNNSNSAFYLNGNSNSSFTGQNQFTSVLPTSTEELLGHHHHHNHTQNNNHHNQNMNHLSQSQHHYTMNHHQYNNPHSSNHNDMLSICDNSSAYASSEDTGLGGGLSETELMASAHDVDENPLGDTRLLEEHDLANVFCALREDELNELFTAVRPDECEEVERALELADKNLKTLQQSIGSESDFLSDFLDVNDDMLADTADDICRKMEIVPSVMHSPDTSGIDTSTLFIDSSGSSSVGGIGSTNCAGVTDIRGLVQT